jgi:hypothetical protein
MAWPLKATALPTLRLSSSQQPSKNIYSRRDNMNTQDFAGILVTLIGAWLLYRSRKRVFDRRNAFGQEVFNSYRHKLTARLIDLILGFFATVVMLTGIIFLAMEPAITNGSIIRPQRFAISLLRSTGKSGQNLKTGLSKKKRRGNQPRRFHFARWFSPWRNA